MRIWMMWKSLFIAILLFINFFPSFVSANKVMFTNEVAVLVYHHIDDQVQGSVTISTRLFEKQMEAMLRQGYRFITMDQFKKFMSEKADVPDNAVLVTFDDGYESFYTKAFPILKKMRIPAVNFVITSGLDDPKGTLLASLSRDEIKQMRKEFAGVDFQLHSDQMHAMKDGKPLLTNKITTNGVTETDNDFKQRVINDTRKCMTKIRDINGAKSVDSYAYPFGSFDNQTISFLNEAGVKFAFTTKAGMTNVETDPMQVPRINAGSPYIRPHSINNLIKQALRHQIPDLTKN
ncbi:polysaccharide deacetylase family protein [Paenibacillus sp. HWE-109]|uniref:polysaccharide deacetylase family protein n=1 Tax=Paenibacillus sp. HWE-109 TaxID=1306526 RepID=UPI001EDF6841|nr:polysaccharide deacetylase family protein [Paenibacillus sp. HWE-109]UKS30586.1 polysaccharide deacetylase family protein [Paenibacillus sp. HWE-109]